MQNSIEHLLQFPNHLHRRKVFIIITFIMDKRKIGNIK